MMHRIDYDFNIETKVEEDGLAPFTGIATSDDIDHIGDVIEAGAFGKTIMPRKVALLRDHDPRAVVGGWKSFTQDGGKLVAEGVVTTVTAAGAETYHLMKQGFLTGLSVGFRCKSGGVIYDEKTGQRRITKAILLECSIVSVPCNDKARVRSVKADDGGLMTEDDVVQWLRDHGVDDEKGFRALLARNAVRREPDEAPTIAPYADEVRGLIATIKGSLTHA